MTAANIRLSKPKAKKQKEQDSPIQEEIQNPIDNAAYFRLSNSALACFQHIVKRELIFHGLFIGLAALSVISFIFFFSFLSDSFLMGIFIACFFFLFVLYFVLKLYFQEHKPSQLLQLRDEYLNQYKALGRNDPKSISSAASDFAQLLEQSKVDYCKIPAFLDFLKPTLEKLILTYHWKDAHLFKELFLRASIDQKVQQVITSPTDASCHKDLADAYMALAEHFRAPLDSMNAASKTARTFWENFQMFARLAIEELLIVKEYAPKDLWTSTKLAECYLSLGMLDQAIVEYEAILEDNENDPEALYSLGLLYFKQGLHGKGLKVYQQLTAFAPSKAEELITMYGTHDSNNFRNV
ncbi:MAG: tetratricopeptide repeat protein [Chlamydiales bacterium]|nr:tetratricopeptide repeat protein [Chlamydiales bacterium]